MTQPPPDTWPSGSEHYKLLHRIGKGATATVMHAICIPTGQEVAIKIIDLENCPSKNLEEIRKEIQLMKLCNNPNLVSYKSSFISEQSLWVVMDYLSGGSIFDIMRCKYPQGLPDEILIATILRDALRGIEYLHNTGKIHRDVKAGNLLVHANGAIKVGDFGVSAWLIEAGMRRQGRQTFVGTPCWMAPEVMEQVCGYDYKADIWSLGITALELAKGQAPLAQYPPMKVLLLTLQNPPPTLEGGYSKSFRDFVESCLQKDPAKRLPAHKLLEHRFFKQAKGPEYVQQVLLKNLPPLWERVSAPSDSDVPQTESRTPGTSWNFSDGELVETILSDNKEAKPVQTSVSTPGSLNTVNEAGRTDLGITDGSAPATEPQVVHKGRFTKTVIKPTTPSTSIPELDEEKTRPNTQTPLGSFDIFQIMNELQKQIQSMAAEIESLKQQNAQLKKELNAKKN